MKTFITALLASTALIACGTNDTSIELPATKKGGEGEARDPYLSDYVKHFYGLCLQTTAANRCEENLNKLSRIDFVDNFDEKVDPTGSVAGICWWARNSRRIEIKKNITKIGSMQERGLIFHELGHCLLDLGHTNPESKMIMNPSLFDEKTYKTNWDRLQNELFAIVLSFVLADEHDTVDDKEIPIF